MLMTMDGLPARANAGVGPFTAAQVTAGHDVFMANCAPCHGPRLTNHDGYPTLTRTRFQDSWGNETTRDLYSFISTYMPYNRPGQLGEESYTNLVAFLLAANGARPGPTPFDKSIAVKIGSITDGETVADVLNPLPSWTKDFYRPCVGTGMLCDLGQ